MSAQGVVAEACRASALVVALQLLAVVVHIVGADGSLGEASSATLTQAPVRVAPVRRLPAIQASISTWQFPAGSTLTIGVGLTAPSDSSIELAAMTQYTGLQIEASAGYTFGSDHDRGRVKLVLAGTTRSACATSDNDVAMSTVTDSQGNVAPSAMGKGNPLAVSDATSYYLNALSALFKFMHGGQFQLCYAPDGTFSPADTSLYDAVFPTWIRVGGVSSSCNTQNCLQTERWNCFYSFKGSQSPSCVMRFTGSNSRPGWNITQPSTGSSMISWTAAFGADSLDSNGLFQDEDSDVCTESEPDTLHFQQGVASYGLDVSTGFITLPSVKAYTTDAFTVSMCYCPSRQAASGVTCARRADFIQGFGRLYMWTVAICDELTLDASCSARYGQVIPQQPFRLRVLCPPGKGCASGSTTNRVRLRASSSDSTRPSWDPLHTCQTMGTSASALFVSWSGGVNVSGGARADYKDFQGTPSPNLKLALGGMAEVCYCDGACDSAANWIHVGRVWVAQAFAFASASAATGGVAALAQAGRPGVVALYGGITSADASLLDPYDGQKYGSTSLVNLLSYDRVPLPGRTQTLQSQLGTDAGDATVMSASLDAVCRQEVYQPDLFGRGPTSQAAAAAFAATPSDRRYLPFDGPSHNQNMVVAQAGVVVVCYCGTVLTTAGTTSCDSPSSNWLFAGFLGIRGPRGGQVWTMARGAIFGLDIEGWGFTSTDRLRVIGAGQDCASNNLNPPGSTAAPYYGCPSLTTAGCLPLPTNHSLTLQVTQGARLTTPVYVTTATVSSTQTTLTFSSSISEILSSGDVISISLSTLKVSGRAQASWTRVDYFNAQRLAGLQAYADDATQSRLLGQMVTLVPGVNNQVTIPVGWSTDPVFTFLNSQGTWTRHNKASTTSDLQAITTTKGLVVCWGAYDGTSVKYSAPAGTIDVVEPPAMPDARVSLTTTQQGAIAPVVVSFGTQATDYNIPSGQVLLKLKFVDTGAAVGPGSGGRLAVLGGTEWLNLTEEVTPSQGRQSTCGRFFLELWSNDDQGFPMPQSCYYGASYRFENTTSFYREIVMVFDAKNSLKNSCMVQGVATSCEYQVVVNAEVGVVAVGDTLAIVDTTCVACTSAYKVFERGYATTFLGTAAAATSTDPRLDLTLLNTDSDNVFDISSVAAGQPLLSLALRGTDTPSQLVTGGAILRLYLWPLTAWELKPADYSAADRACNATCQAQSGTKPGAGRPWICGAVACNISSVQNTTSMHRNGVMLTLPSGMDNITASTMAHTIKVWQLLIPSEGWFPTRFGWQLTTATDTKPYYSASSRFYQKTPDQGATTGRLLVTGRTGYGTRPFASDQDNLILLRLVLGATIRGTTVAPAPKLRVTLPPGYNCGTSVATMSTAPPTFTEPVFSADADGDGYLDHNRGFLSNQPVDGRWYREAGSCTYEPAPNSRVYSGTVLFVHLLVDNPTAALSKFTSTNVWGVNLQSKGASSRTTLYSFPTAPFITTAEASRLGGDTWAASCAVLGPVVAASQGMTPGSFARGATHNLTVFFRPTIGLDSNGVVVVDGMDGFDFGNPCQVFDLASVYYMALPSGAVSTKRVDAVTTCNASRWPASASSNNRARFQVTRGLLAGTPYAFTIVVKNPSAYPSTLRSWMVWTESPQGSGVEGTQVAPRFNPMVAGDWGLYDQDLLTFRVVFPNNVARPSSLTGSSSKVRFLGLTVPTTGVQTVRLTAPMGFTFDASGTQAVGFSAIPAGTDGATALWPSVPTVGNPNELLFTATSLVAGQMYAFQASVRIPDQLPTTSTRSFYVEFGSDATTFPARLQAGQAPSSVLQAITNASLQYLSRVAGDRSNHVTMIFRTASPVPAGGGIVIDSATTGLVFICPQRLSDGPLPFPEGARCSSNKTYPRIVVLAGADGIPAGLYQIDANVNNPSTTPGGVWTFGTYATGVQPGTDPSGPIDKGVSLPGFDISEAMQQAFLVSARLASGRFDRPAARNQLTFAFMLRISSAGGYGVLAIRGPQGVVFDDHCVESVETNLTAIFGGSPPASYATWPTLGAISACIGNGPTAYVTLGSGFTAGSLYALRIGVRQNPVLTPLVNLWTLDFRGEPSSPFVGFQVWTFSDAAVMPAATARGPRWSMLSEAVPVAVRFRGVNTIPAPGGLLTLQAPSGFAFSNCTVELVYDGVVPPAVWAPSELNCSVTSASTLVVQILSGRAILAGALHYLTVYVMFPTADQVSVQAGQWRLQSFARGPAVAANALDDVLIPGFPLTAGLPAFSVTNTLGLTKGGLSLPVAVRVAPTDPLQQGDTVVLLSPAGFSFEDSSRRGSCKNLRWVTPSSPAAGWGTPACPCNATLHGSFINGLTDCALSWTIGVSDPTILLEFTAVGVNPTMRPRWARNMWSAQIWRGLAPLAGRAYPSWTVEPQLVGTTVEIVGPRAAGAITSFRIGFVAAYPAGVLLVRALSPAGFNFDSATVAAPNAINDNATGGNQILVETQIAVGQTVSILLEQVLLSPVGGTTVFQIRTYTGPDMEVWQEGLDGFTTSWPGKVDVVSSALWCQYSTDPVSYPIMSDLPPRIGELSWAELNFTLTQPVPRGQVLTVSSIGDSPYRLQAQQFVLSRLPASGTQGTSVLRTSPTLVSGSALRIALLDDLDTSSMYKLRFAAIATSVTSSIFLVEASNGSAYPTNTNDGEDLGFRPVPQMQFNVSSPRAPPRASVNVTLWVMAYVNGTPFELVAPMGFVFPAGAGACGASATALVVCTAAGTMNGRPLARLSGPGGTGSPTLTGSLTLRVTLPEVMEDQPRWLVMSRATPAAPPSWESQASFSLQPIQGVDFNYAAIAGQNLTQVVATFTLLDAAAGVRLRVRAPVGYTLACAVGSTVDALALPGGVPLCMDTIGSSVLAWAAGLQPRELSVELNGTTFSPGSYAFGFRCNVPMDEDAETDDPSRVTWSLIIYNAGGAIVHSAFRVPSRRIVHANVGDPIFAWSRSLPDQPSLVTFGITVREALVGVRSVLFVLPQWVVHDCRQPGDFVVLRGGFPSAGVNLDYASRVQLYVIENATIPAGTYRFQFRILVPSVLPDQNLWYLALCSSVSCTSPADPDVILSFALTGFRLGERSTVDVNVITSRAARLAGSLGKAWAAIVALVFLSLVVPGNSRR